LDGGNRSSSGERTAQSGSLGVPWAATALASASERRAAGTFMMAV
jgi:hypothetical protein